MCTLIRHYTTSFKRTVNISVSDILNFNLNIRYYSILYLIDLIMRCCSLMYLIAVVAIDQEIVSIVCKMILY